MTLQTLQKEAREEFEAAFMNNGLNGVLDDKFQDARILTIKHFIDSLITKAYKQGVADSVECVPRELTIKDVQLSGGMITKEMVITRCDHRNLTLKALKQLTK